MPPQQAEEIFRAVAREGADMPPDELAQVVAERGGVRGSGASRRERRDESVKTGASRRERRDGSSNIPLNRFLLVEVTAAAAADSINADGDLSTR